MARTGLSGLQIKDRSIQKDDIDVQTTGHAVITSVSVTEGQGVSISSSGADAGTGDVTLSIDRDSIDKTYNHNQMSPAEVWTIHHNLNKYPSVAVFDSTGDGELVYGDIAYVDANTLTVSFSAGFAGMAFLN